MIEFVKNNKSNYKILLPKVPSYYEEFGANDLQKLLKESTKVNFEITTDYNAKEKYISIGNTILLNETKNIYGYGVLKDQGFCITYTNKNIIIYGARDKGILNGVYGFLEKYLDFDNFAEDNYWINKVDNLTLDEVEFFDTPDIQIRLGGMGFMRLNETTKNRMRAINYRDIFPDVADQGAYHNCFGYISPKKYGQTHKEWFNDSQTQLCCTAHGDEKSRREMINIVANTTYDTLISTGREKIVFALNDNFEICTCPSCRKLKEKYGADSGAVILFLNEIVEIVENKFKETNDKRKDSFMLLFYAYHALLEAPVQLVKRLDKYGEYQLSHYKEMELNKHLTVMYANSLCHTTSWYYDQKNEEQLLTFKKWNSIASNIHFWIYDTYFINGGFFYPYNSYKKIPQIYKFAKENDVQYVSPEADVYSKNTTCFGFLKGYLQTKFGWRTDRNLEEYTLKFFKNTYGSVFRTIYEIYRDLTMWLDYQINTLNIQTWATQTKEFTLKKFWNKYSIFNYIKLYEECLVQLLENNEQKAIKFVEIEEVSPLYIALRTFGDELDEKTYDMFFNRFVELVNKYEFETTCQGESIEDAIDNIKNHLYNEN